MTQPFVPTPRRPLAVPPADITVDPPPPPPASAPAALLARVAPMALSGVGLGVMAVLFGSGAAAGRGPALLALPVMMLASTALAAITGRAGRRGGAVDSDRVDYLDHLGQVGEQAERAAALQREALQGDHPDPGGLWMVIGGPRMWERDADDPQFCVLRAGVGARPLAGRIDIPRDRPVDPVTAAALDRFEACHSTIVAPVTVDLRGGPVTIAGDPASARGLVRALICQLAAMHRPDQVSIVAAVSESTLEHWDWLKWLPHNQHPGALAALGPVRMVYADAASAARAIAALPAGRVVLIADLAGVTDPPAAQMTLEVAGGPAGAPVIVRQFGAVVDVGRPDGVELLDALIVARRMARYRIGDDHARQTDWARLVGLADLPRFDPTTSWRSQPPRLRAPIGTAAGGGALELDISEPAARGMGPHGLCVGATGSGKSELLRTIALGMMVRNPPDVLNLLLVDFKGGATFSDYGRCPHVTAVITNLADDAPLVDRMRAALFGELDRRQQLLRAAGCDGLAAYERERSGGRVLAALPTLFVIVDEFSELLGQHPDFADTFAAIGRLGRSLGVHLLLASQRLDEGRLRGLDAHLSYRICLKTLSAADSRAALGTLDAYALPNTPGAGFLRVGGDEPVRFHAALVSGPVRAPTTAHGPAVTSARVFCSGPAGAISPGGPKGASPAPTVLGTVLDRLSRHGPPAHRVWLPPLGSSPTLDCLLRDGVPEPDGMRVPVGLVDRPFEQRRAPLLVDLSGSAGNVAIVGAPQSGKSTALRTLITALAATHDARRVQFYCLDFGGGALASVRALPHVGAVAGRADPRLAAQVVGECQALVRSREAAFSERGIVSIAHYRRQRSPSDGDPFGDVFLVVDGWGGVRGELEALESSITALAAQGLSFGVHVILTATRWAEVRPALRDTIGTRIELRLGDPADSELDRRAARHVPADRPGRGLSHDGMHMVIALPEAAVPSGAGAAPPIRPLPIRVDRDALPRGVGIVVGLEEHQLRPLEIDFARHGHLLVFGEDGCGKTATLRTVCREVVRGRTAAQALLLVVDFRRSLLGVAASEHCGGYAMSPPALDALLAELLDQLRSRMPPAEATLARLRSELRSPGPDLYLVVDDYDLVVTPPGGALSSLLEFLPYARDLRLHLILARRSGGMERALFEPLLAGLRDQGCLTLRMSGCPGDGAAFGAAAPAVLPPGRGVLTGRGNESRVVQVAWSEP